MHCHNPALDASGPASTSTVDRGRNPVIRVLLAHQGTLLRGALAAVLSGEADMRVAAEVAHGDTLLPAAMEVQPDIAVLHHALPGTSPVTELCRRLAVTLPGCAALVMLDRRSAVTVGGALARLLPRVGLIATEASPAELVGSVRQLAKGEPVLDIRLAVVALTAQENPLTERECEVLRLAVDGTPAKEIAGRLFLSAGTVRNYLARIVSKTGARTRIEAIRIAQEAGWI
jgi:two-component system response regulator DesR